MLENFKAKLANKLKYKIDFGICTEHLITIAYG